MHWQKQSVFTMGWSWRMPKESTIHACILQKIMWTMLLILIVNTFTWQRHLKIDQQTQGVLSSMFFPFYPMLTPSSVKIGCLILYLSLWADPQVVSGLLLLTDCVKALIPITDFVLKQRYCKGSPIKYLWLQWPHYNACPANLSMFVEWRYMEDRKIKKWLLTGSYSPVKQQFNISNKCLTVKGNKMTLKHLSSTYRVN